MSVPEDPFEYRVQQHQAMTRSALETVPVESAKPHGNIPNTPLVSSLISFVLGALFLLGSIAFVNGGYPGSSWVTWQLGGFIATWAIFHYLEFAVTAGWNREKCSVDSYLLDNGKEYHLANTAAFLEYVVAHAWNPKTKTYPYVSEIGIALILGGQFLRSIAMVHAATNFSHAVAFNKRKDHVLVTDGVYAWFRHPSYAGFFYWGIGTQLLLQNPICFVLYACLLWRFFYYRLKFEEANLIKFFGNEYKEYRARVKVWIPFIG
ncbi:hypothetical protein D9611_002422 [Ephemerocybe angulata]|uniref:Protein-S-isoprenylcysteine O-methyltransferase n=2 Tax=Ephemerocybe angulata TaxID=980116 RepID=A0A8H6IDN1_9AGAR|nr:hypothetical protein D9611_002422 [Tulosesus angulatus]KAF6762323.1 prenyl cysteine carboxyl methyltransferase Ste14 [Tulosesus angulatus]